MFEPDFIHSDRSSVVLERDDGVHAHGATQRNRATEQRDREQHQGRERQRERVVRRHADELRLEQRRCSRSCAASAPT